jgi:uncharacterized protein (TIRG00374 family)
VKGKLALGIALGALFLWLSVRKVHFGEMQATLQEAHYHYFLGMLALNLAVIWIRAVRWRVLLQPVRDVPASRLLSPMCVGFMFNFIFPARAGEFIRAYLVGKKEGISKSSAFATVVVERLFDGLAIISFLGMAPFLLPGMEGTSAQLLQWAGLAVFVFYFGVLGALFILSHHREALAAYLERSSAARRWKVVHHFLEMLQKFADGLAILKSRKEIASALALSYVVWGFAAAINYLMMQSIGLQLPLYAAFFLVVIQSFGVMVPSPGFVGGYQAAHTFALMVYSVAESKAFSLSILIHSGYFITFVGLGLLFLGRDHLNWRELEKASVERDP